MISKNCDEMVNEAHRILKEIDNRVYVKIPVSYEGIKAIKILKAERHQCYSNCCLRPDAGIYWQLAAGADYIAPLC